MPARFHFRPLALELGGTTLASTAGFHDLERPTVQASHIGNPIVSLHEGIHDELLRSTAFGGTQVWFKRLFEHATDSRVRNPAGRWQEELVRGSVTTQECAATYLSIKCLLKDEHKALLDKHPPSYQHYFSLLAETIDLLALMCFRRTNRAIKAGEAK